MVFEGMAQSLTRTYMEEEVKTALFPDAPIQITKPDGMSLFFFQNSSILLDMMLLLLYYLFYTQGNT